MLISYKDILALKQINISLTLLVRIFRTHLFGECVSSLTFLLSNPAPTLEQRCS